jgi:phosphate transport system substrate-binding protein
MKLSKLILTISTAALLAGCGGASDTAKDAMKDTMKEGAKKAANAAESAAAAVGADARRDIRIVGSSTVYPFSTKVAQEFKNKSGFNVVVESTGSGGGHKLFCSGVGSETPDVTNSSRRQKQSEFQKCMDSGIEGVIEVKIGYDGIVIANAIDSDTVDLSLKDIYLALAKNVPSSHTDCTMVPNPAVKWSDVNPSLPGYKIEAFGPPPTSGTRDAFVEIAMEGGAKKIPCLADLRGADKKAFKAASHTIREDGKWIDAGENDNALVQTLVNTPTAVGVFGYSFLDQNGDKIKGAKVDSAEPTFENIASGVYPVSRSLYFYMKKDHVGKTPGLQEYAMEFLSDSAAGEGGYLEEIGLVPLPAEERAAFAEAVRELKPYSQ